MSDAVHNTAFGSVICVTTFHPDAVQAVLPGGERSALRPSALARERTRDPLLIRHTNFWFIWRVRHSVLYIPKPPINAIVACVPHLQRSWSRSGCLVSTVDGVLSREGPKTKGHTPLPHGVCARYFGEGMDDAVHSTALDSVTCVHPSCADAA